MTANLKLTYSLYNIILKLKVRMWGNSMEISTVTGKGQIVIPSRIRRQYDIKKGTKVCFIEDGENIILQPITKDFYKKVRGSLKNANLIEDLLEERKKEREMP